MTKTDAEHRFFAEQLSDRIYNPFNTFRVTRPVGEKNAVRIHIENSFGICCCRDNLHSAAFFLKNSDLVIFDTKIEGDDLQL